MPWEEAQQKAQRTKARRERKAWGTQRPHGQVPRSAKQRKRRSARRRTGRSDVFLQARRHELLTARGTRRIRTTAAGKTACRRFAQGAKT